MKKLITVGLTSRIADMRIILISVLFVFFSCKGQKDATMAAQEVSSNNALELLVQDQYSGADVSESLIIKNAKELKAFYSKINRTRKPGLPIPEVDFAKEMIVVHCSGERNDGSFPVLSISNETDNEMVFVAKNERIDTTSKAVTSPFSLYKMPLTDKAIIFEKAQK